MTYAIQAEGLEKRFGETRALDGVSLTAEAGTVLGVLGPNGAGKTTMTRILATLIEPTGGTAQVGGFDVLRDAHKVRQLIGLTGQYAGVDEMLTGTENLILIGRLLGIPRKAARARAAELLERFQLTEAAERAAKTYSGGMRRRLDLAASLVGDPQILFLDEPTTGLDPRSRNGLWDIVRGLTDDGVTVLLTTQYLEEADQLADDIIVIDRGQVIAHGTSDMLKAQVGGQVLEVRPVKESDGDTVAAIVGELAEAAPEVRDGLISAPITDPQLMPAVVRRLDDAGVAVGELSLRKSSLDEVFFALTGHHTDDIDAEADRLADLSRRVAPGTALRNIATLAWRNLVQIKHNPMELLDLSIQPIMFVLLFAYVFGPAMAGSVEAYLPVVIPGIIAQNALFAGMSTGFGLNTDITKGVFDRFRSLPIARSAPLVGRIIADTVKQAWSMLILLLVGFAIGFRIETNVIALLAAFLLLLAFAVLFSWTSVYIAMKVNEPEKVQIFGFVVIFPLSFLSTAFIPNTEGIPGPVAFVMDNSPVTQLVQAMRGLLVGGPVLDHALIALAWGVAISVVFAPLSLRAFKNRA